MWLTVYFKWVGAPNTRAETLPPFSTSLTRQFLFYDLVPSAKYYFRSNIPISVLISMQFHGEDGAVRGGWKVISSGCGSLYSHLSSIEKNRQLCR